MTATRQFRFRRTAVISIAAAIVALAAMIALRPIATSSAQAPVDVAVDLCAKEGTVALPGAPSTPIWGLANKPSGVDCTDNSVEAGIPGPLLEANEGDLVSVTLTNTLADAVSIDFPGMQVDPGPSEAAAGGDVTYEFTAERPGTYLYVSGSGAGRHAAMGLYGALVVRPGTAGQAYDDASTAYDQEAVAVLSEIDALFNAGPGAFDMLNWGPRYWLINGEAYPDTDTISAAAGDRVLLRYVNPGPETVTMTMLGAHGRLLATDAFQPNAPFDVVSQTVAAGQTADLLVTVPGSAAPGDRFPLYNRQLHVTNGGLANPQHKPGGMLTFIEVAGGGP